MVLDAVFELVASIKARAYVVVLGRCIEFTRRERQLARSDFFDA